MGIDGPIRLGPVFCGRGVLVALFAVFFAPRLQRRLGTANTEYGTFVLLALDLAVIAVFRRSPVVVIVCVIVAGAFIGTNNALVTTAVGRSRPSSGRSHPRPAGSCASSAAGSTPSSPARWFRPRAAARCFPFFFAAGVVPVAAIVLCR